MMNHLTIREPLGAFDGLLENFFDLKPRYLDWEAEGTLRANIEESDTHYEVSFQVPGVSKEQISVDLDGNKLRVTVSTTNQTETKNKVLMKEIRTSSASRLVTLPKEVSRESVEATLKDGILRLKVEKVSAPKPFKIEIK